MSFPELKPFVVNTVKPFEAVRLTEVKVWAQALAKKTWKYIEEEKYDDLYSVYSELLRVGKTK